MAGGMKKARVEVVFGYIDWSGRKVYYVAIVYGVKNKLVAVECEVRPAADIAGLLRRCRGLREVESSLVVYVV